MRRIVLAGLAGVLALASAAQAQSAYDNVVKKFGEAYAIADQCNELEINPERMSIYTVALGIEIDAEFKRRVEQEFVEVRPMIKKNATHVCAIGRLLYGPDGQNAPGLLREE